VRKVDPCLQGARRDNFHGNILALSLSLSPFLHAFLFSGGFLRATFYRSLSQSTRIASEGKRKRTPRFRRSPLHDFPGIPEVLDPCSFRYAGKVAVVRRFEQLLSRDVRPEMLPINVSGRRSPATDSEHVRNRSPA